MVKPPLRRLGGRNRTKQSTFSLPIKRGNSRSIGCMSRVHLNNASSLSVDSQALPSHRSRRSSDGPASLLGALAFRSNDQG